jgi:hypothetical protein
MKILPRVFHQGGLIKWTLREIDFRQSENRMLGKAGFIQTGCALNAFAKNAQRKIIENIFRG